MASDTPFARHGILPPVTRPAAWGGLLTAGMIVAGLSFVASMVFAGYGAAVYMNSTVARDRLLRNAPADLPVAAPAQSAVITTPVVTLAGAHGMDPAQRSAAVDSISQRIEMTPVQARQLEALLAEDGTEIFAFHPGETASPPAILERIGDHVGRLPTADTSEPFFFETPAGRAEIYDNRALFYRAHTLNPVRAVAGRRANQSGHPILLPADVNAIVELVEEACARGGSNGKPLNEPQVQMLRSLLSDPQQKLVSVISAPEGDQFGINGATVRPDGYALVNFTGGELMLGPAGNIILRADASSISSVSPAACGLVVITGLVSIGMAVFLLIICLGLSRAPRRRPKPLVLWSAWKMALSLVAATAAGWMTASFMSNSRIDSTARASVPVSLALAVAVAVIGCAFPVTALLIARSRGVREYYDPTA